MYKDRQVYAVVLAAGKGTRIGFDKMLYKLDKYTVAEHSILAFENNDNIDKIILAAGENYDEICSLSKGFSKTAAVVKGGATRAVSVLNALKEVPEGRIVAIHDGARPYVSQEIITRAVAAAAEHGAAIPCVKVKDTVKQGAGGFIEKTIPRDSMMVISFFDTQTHPSNDNC